MKKLFFYSGFIAFALVAAMSCKKDDDSVPNYVSGLAGGWKYFKGATNEKYLQLYKDNSFSILYSDLQGIRGRYDGMVLVNTSQIMIDNVSLGQFASALKTVDKSVMTLKSTTSANIYNYSVKGDTLMLSRLSEKILLVRDKAAPDTSAWIKPITAVSKMKAPISDVTDITYDGALLWYGNAYSTDYIYKYNLTNGTKDSVMVSQSAWAVEADGSYLWLSSDGSDKIYKINKSTGSVLTTSISMGSWIYGIAKDNNFLWCYSHNENTLYKYNTTDNTVPLTYTIDGNWDGLAIAGGYLYAAANGQLHKCTISPLMEVSSFELPGYYIVGVANDGSSFWVSAYKLPNAWPEIIKLSGVD